MTIKILSNPSPRTNLKSFLTRIPFLVAVKRAVEDLLNIDGKRGKTKLDVTASFPLFHPCSLGTYKSRAKLTIQTINQLMPVLWSLIQSLGYKKIQTIELDEFINTEEQTRVANELKILFDKYQSDKATTHNYHLLYGFILAQRKEIKRVFEIGLGTNNTDVVSNMGIKGQPGASLRAFRDFLANAQIFGADVDRRVLFAEERIQTYYVDQTNESSFELLNESLPADFDLMIDDGLHSPNANLQSLKLFLPKIRIGGWAIIEDIGNAALPLWEIVGAILPSNYQPIIFKTKGAILFAVKRVT